MDNRRTKIQIVYEKPNWLSATFRRISLEIFLQHTEMNILLTHTFYHIKYIEILTHPLAKTV